MHRKWHLSRAKWCLLHATIKECYIDFIPTTFLHFFMGFESLKKYILNDTSEADWIHLKTFLDTF